MHEDFEEQARARKERSHQEALAAARIGKAILSPDHVTRQFVFAIVGGLFFASTASSCLALIFNIGPGFTLGLVVLSAFALGLISGLYYFHATHVIDESLETSIFEKYQAHRTVRETYFKR